MEKEHFFDITWPRFSIIRKPGYRGFCLLPSGLVEYSPRTISRRGSNYLVILRRSRINTLDFSVILSIERPRSNQVFILRRYNGKSHHHTNKIEGTRFYDFHIHQATERYQLHGMNPEGYATPCDEYSNFDEALFCLLRDCNFEKPRDQHPELFN